jgi:hypothetical protein
MDELTLCPGCKGKVPEGKEFCPWCQKRLREPKQPPLTLARVLRGDYVPPPASLLFARVAMFGVCLVALVSLAGAAVAFFGVLSGGPFGHVVTGWTGMAVGAIFLALAAALGLLLKIEEHLRPRA